MATLVVGRKYLTKHGILTYAGMYSYPGFTCDGCKKVRDRFHEFVVGDVDNPHEHWDYGSECVKHIGLKPIEEA